MNKLVFITVFCLLLAGSVYAGQNKQNSLTEWRQWIGPQQNYLDKIESVMNRVSEIETQQNSDLQDAINKKDKTLGDNVIASTAGRLSAIIDEMEALTPPKEFKEYHDKIIESYKFRQMANEATLKKNLFNIKDCGNKAVASELDAMESIKKLYISHGAPSQVIDSIDRKIASYKQRSVL